MCFVYFQIHLCFIICLLYVCVYVCVCVFYFYFCLLSAIVPIRSPCTSLTKPISSQNSPPSHVFYASSTSSSSSYSSPNSPPKHASSSLSTVLNRLAKSPTKCLIGRGKRIDQAVLPSGPSSSSSGDNTSYMNIVLAQIGVFKC